MENKPFLTREYAQAMASCMDGPGCEGCPAIEWCDDFVCSTFTGRALLHLHNRIDSLEDLIYRMASQLAELAPADCDHPANDLLWECNDICVRRSPS